MDGIDQPRQLHFDTMTDGTAGFGGVGGGFPIGGKGGGPSPTKGDVYTENQGYRANGSQQLIGCDC